VSDELELRWLVIAGSLGNITAFFLFEDGILIISLKVSKAWWSMRNRNEAKVAPQEGRFYRLKRASEETLNVETEKGGEIFLVALASHVRCA
jgi:hypothetical protein